MEERILPIYQPLRWMFVLTLVFCFLSYRFSLAMPILFTLLLTFIILMLGKVKRYPQFPAMMILLVIMAVAVFRCGYTFHTKDEKLLQYQGQSVSIVAELKEVTYESHYSKIFIAEVDTCQRESVNGKISIATSADRDYQAGDVIAAEVKFTLPEEYIFSFQNRLYQRSQGILLEAGTIENSDRLLDHKNHPIDETITNLRALLSERFGTLGLEEASFLRALLLGERDGIPTEVQRDFTKIGASHILAISGLHFSVVCGLFYLLLRKFVHSFHLRSYLYMAFLVFFCLLCGCSPSAMRACGMLLLATIVHLNYMDADPLSILSFMGILMLAWNPYYILNISFLLSYAAAFGILFFLPEDEEKAVGFFPRLAQVLKNAIFPSAAAFLFTLPFCAFFFRKISTYAILSSLILVPLCTLCIYSGLLVLILPSGLTSLSFFNTVLSFPSRLFYRIVDWLAHKNGITVFLQSGTIQHGIYLFLALICLFVIFLSPRKKSLLLVLCIILCITFGIHAYQTRPQEALTVHVYTLENQQVFLINDADSHYMMLNSTVDDILLRHAIEDYTMRCEQDHLDGVILRGYDTSSLSALKDFAKRYYVETVYLPKETDHTQMFISALTPSHAEFVFYDCTYVCDAFSFYTYGDACFSFTLNGKTLAAFSGRWYESIPQVNLYRTLIADPGVACFFFPANASNIPNESRIQILAQESDIILEKFVYPLS